MNEREQMAAGTRAKNDYEITLKAAIAAMRQGVIDKWCASPIPDKDGQHELRLLLKVVNDLEGNILKIINDGVMAKAIIEQEEKAK
jgi:hypothetical protein